MRLEHRHANSWLLAIVGTGIVISANKPPSSWSILDPPVSHSRSSSRTGCFHGQQGRYQKHRLPGRSSAAAGIPGGRAPPGECPHPTETQRAKSRPVSAYQSVKHHSLQAQRNRNIQEVLKSCNKIMYNVADSQYCAPESKTFDMHHLPFTVWHVCACLSVPVCMEKLDLLSQYMYGGSKLDTIN